MHTDCFEVWQNSLLSRLNKSKEGQKKLRHWSEKQKLQNLWKQQQGYNLVSEACACKCGEGTVRKHLNWVPPKSNSSGECRLHLYSCVSLSNIVPSGPNSDSEKQKRRRKKSNKNSKPALTIGLPTFVNGLQVKCTLDHIETITILPCRWWREVTYKEFPRGKEPTRCPRLTLAPHHGAPREPRQQILLLTRRSSHPDSWTCETGLGKSRSSR